jgi:hypothetical protein
MPCVYIPLQCFVRKCTQQVERLAAPEGIRTLGRCEKPHGGELGLFVVFRSVMCFVVDAFFGYLRGSSLALLPLPSLLRCQGRVHPFSFGGDRPERAIAAVAAVIRRFPAGSPLFYGRAIRGFRYRT